MAKLTLSEIAEVLKDCRENRILELDAIADSLACAAGLDDEERDQFMRDCGAL